MESTPVAILTGTKQKPAPSGRYFVGELKSAPRIVRLARGSKEVYEFAYLDGDAPIEKKSDTGEYKSVTLKAGDKVSVFCPTVLASALKEAKIGDVIQIVYRGMPTTSAGVQYHSFEVEAFTMEEYHALNQSR